MINRNDKGNNELLRKMDSLLWLLVEHTNKHENCCLKNILKIMSLGQVSTPAPNNNTAIPRVGDSYDK